MEIEVTTESREVNQAFTTLNELARLLEAVDADCESEIDAIRKKLDLCIIRKWDLHGVFGLKIFCYQTYHEIGKTNCIVVDYNGHEVVITQSSTKFLMTSNRSSVTKCFDRYDHAEGTAMAFQIEIDELTLNM